MTIYEVEPSRTPTSKRLEPDWAQKRQNNSEKPSFSAEAPERNCGTSVRNWRSFKRNATVVDDVGEVSAEQLAL